MLFISFNSKFNIVQYQGYGDQCSSMCTFSNGQKSNVGHFAYSRLLYLKRCIFNVETQSVYGFSLSKQLHRTYNYVNKINQILHFMIPCII